MIPGKYRLGEEDTLLLASFERFRKEIVKLQSDALRDEDLRGESGRFCKIQYLHLVSYWHLLALLRIKDGTSYEDTRELLNFDSVEHCLSCNGIPPGSMEAIWRLKRESSSGVASESLDGSFEVGFFSERIETAKGDMKALLSMPEGCCPVDGSIVEVLATQDLDAVSTQEGAYILI